MSTFTATMLPVVKVGENRMELAGQIATAQGEEPKKIVRRGGVLDVLKQVVVE